MVLGILVYNRVAVYLDGEIGFENSKSGWDGENQIPRPDLAGPKENTS